MNIANVQLPDFPLLLAPMEDVSDPPFRVLCKEQGADLVFSEFISSEALARDIASSQKKMDIFEGESPVGIQIFGGDAEVMARAAEIVNASKADLLDINFGCPVKKVVRKGAGAGVLKDVDLMCRLTRETARSTPLPLTIKTRLGWSQTDIHIVEVCEKLQDAGARAITLHARTREQMYKGEADWSWTERIKNNPRFHIPLFGNGDIDSPEKALAYKNKYPVDGMMIGRAAIGNPWIFRDIKHYFKTGELLTAPDFHERAKMCLRHLRLSVAWKGERTGVLEMRRHYAKYFRALPTAKDLRAHLVVAKSAQEIEDILGEAAKCY